jgi:hypothetical protein
MKESVQQHEPRTNITIGKLYDRLTREETIFRSTAWTTECRTNI